MVHRPLINYLERRANSYLRAVGRYDADGCELVYAREGLDRGKLRDRLNAMYENIVWDWRPADNPDMDALGDTRATLHIRESAVILHFPLEDGRGILVGFDPDAGRDLTTFVNECLSLVDREREIPT